MEQTQRKSARMRDPKDAGPRMMKVIMHNDDVTTFGFVVMVLQSVFFKTEEQARQLAMRVHEKGSATVGTYPADIAKSKRDKATKMARDEGYPLRLTVVDA